MKIRIIGYGRLAQSLVPNWIKNHDIVASSPNIQSHTKIHCIHENKQFLDANVIILCVKPQLIGTVLSEIGMHIPNHSVIISTAAGLSLKQIKGYLSSSIQVYRAMPNIAASIGKSATLLYGDSHSSLVESLFLEIGQIDWVDNDDILDLGTILAGSGPAYFYYFMQQLQKSIVDLGMPEDLAKKLILQTGLGATQLAQQASISLEALQQQVTSPKGTTAAAIDIFENAHLGEILQDGLNAAWQRVLKLRTEI